MEEEVVIGDGEGVAQTTSSSSLLLFRSANVKERGKKSGSCKGDGWAVLEGRSKGRYRWWFCDVPSMKEKTKSMTGGLRRKEEELEVTGKQVRVAGDLSQPDS